MAVHATFAEAAALAHHLTDEQEQRLNDYVERLKKTVLQTANMQQYLRLHREAIGPCPFLDSRNNCEIYPHRPLSCRALLSTRPAAWCSVDFNALDAWDKQSYEKGLDPQIVAWPTHYVAATQDFGRELEKTLNQSMKKNQGWSLYGNFPAMIWLVQQDQLDHRSFASRAELETFFAASGLNHEAIFSITFSKGSHQE
jgi:hypothetical protein